eukprot:scaffold48413_cov51-Phaeocystis_antarctica.AAC.1
MAVGAQQHLRSPGNPAKGLGALSVLCGVCGEGDDGGRRLPAVPGAAGGQRRQDPVRDLGHGGLGALQGPRPDGAPIVSIALSLALAAATAATAGGRVLRLS